MPDLYPAKQIIVEIGSQSEPFLVECKALIEKKEIIFRARFQNPTGLLHEIPLDSMLLSKQYELRENTMRPLIEPDPFCFIIDSLRGEQHKKRVTLLG